MKKLINNITLKIIFIFFYFCSPFILADNINDISRFKGYKVNFDYTNHSTEREIVYQHLIDKYGNDDETPIIRDNIGIDLYDIDNDGENEILVYITNKGFCGSGGCIFKILKLNSNKKQKKITKIFFRVAHDDIKILDNITLGHHDISLGTDYINVPTILKWNGETYDYSD